MENDTVVIHRVIDCRHDPKWIGSQLRARGIRLRASLPRFDLLESEGQTLHANAIRLTVSAGIMQLGGRVAG